MIAERIKYLREQNNMTQSQLAKRLGVTRSGVNAWEMGLSVPSTQSVVELALLFKVSTDFLLNLPSDSMISIDGLTEDDTCVVYSLINHLKTKNGYNKI